MGPHLRYTMGVSGRCPRPGALCPGTALLVLRASERGYVYVC